jgi:hypothetical protein
MDCTLQAAMTTLDKPFSLRVVPDDQPPVLSGIPLESQCGHQPKGE